MKAKETAEIICFLFKLVVIKALLFIPIVAVGIVLKTAKVMKRAVDAMEDELLNGEMREKYGRGSRKEFDQVRTR